MRKVYYVIRFFWIDFKWLLLTGMHIRWAHCWKRAEDKMIAEGRRGADR